MVKVLELFGGIGACTKAFKRLGIDYEVVDYVEIDKYAVKSYNAINGTNFPPQDITKWDKDIDVDFIMHGSPCFVAGTKVNTDKGLKNIEDIVVGDVVKSHDGTYNKVIETMEHISPVICKLELNQSSQINVSEIYVTPNHPFYIKRGQLFQWVEVKDLTSEDCVTLPVSKDEYCYVSVKSISFAKCPQKVYNLEVENTHTYCVYGVAVHNCQDFSVAGLGKGGDEGSGTRSSLMYETIRIVKKLKPKYVCWENVKNLLSEKHIHNFENYLTIMDNLGYDNYYQVLNAKNYGIPQNRERVFTISIRKDVNTNPWGYIFPQPIPLTKTLKDLLDTNVAEKYYLSDKMLKYLTGENQKESKFPRGERWYQQLETTNEKGIAATISTNAGNRPVDNFILDEPEDLDIIKSMVTKEDDTNLLDEEEEPEEHKTWLQNKLEEVYKEKGYIPDILNPFNKQEIKDGIIPTLTTSGSPCVRTGIVIKEETKIPDLPIKVGNYSPSGHNAASVVDSSGIAPCVMENHGTVTAVVEDNNPKVIAGIGEKKSNGGTQWYQQDRVYDDKIAMSVTSGFLPYYKTGIRIRKLTPKECWRLQGFDDQDFERASKVNSDAQLYKQAGNSIVVNCLEAMFKNLFSDSVPDGVAYEVVLF